MANKDDGKILKCTQTYDPNIPEIPLHQYVMREMIKRQHCIAAIDASTKKQWTYAELVLAVERLSAGLQAGQGLQKGQFVAIALPTSVESLISLLAVNRCGAVASLVNPMYTATELKHVVGQIRPSFWICTAEFAPLLPSLAADGYGTRAIVVDFSQERSQWHSVLESGRPEDFKSPSINVKQDLATMPFSSGTTGMPKAVMLTHFNMVTALCQFKVWVPYTAEDTNLCMLPMYHQYACLIVLTTIATGARVVLMPKFTLPEMLKTIQDYKVTRFPLVPTIAVLLAKHPLVAQFDLSSLKGIVSTSAPLSVEIIDMLKSKFGCEILQGYGLTEVTLASHFTPKGEQKDGSVGKLMPFFEGKIVDPESGKTLGVGEVGEICLRGHMVMKGYRDNEAATADMIDRDGWLHSGDIGYYDEDEWFFIVDRLKELIKYKGRQVAPSELERILLTHPDVTEAAVVGVPDETAGELPRAYVVKRPESSVTEQQLQEFVKAEVSPYKWLRGGVHFMDALPKLASGKILRRELKAKARL